MNSIFAAVDIYCERMAPGLFNEPLNAISNLSFFIAAWLLYKSYATLGKPDAAIRSLIGCLALIGCGSLTFHTFANWISMAADIMPILMFVLYYLWIALQRLLGWGYVKTFSCLVIFMIILIQAHELPPEYSFNGSSGYFPCLTAIGLIAWTIRRQYPQTAGLLWKGFFLLILSLTFRSVDIAVCDHFPPGTHFLWHICNGIVLYLLTSALINPSSKPTN